MSATDTATRTITLRRIGNSVGATFPKEVLDRLGLEAKSELLLIETEDGFMLKRYDPDFDKGWAAYLDAKKRYHNVFKELAK